MGCTGQNEGKGREGMGMPYELHKSCDFVIFGEEFQLVNALQCISIYYCCTN